MLDVKQIAIEYRKALLRDIARVDAFLRLADDLVRQQKGASLSPRNITSKVPTAIRSEEPEMEQARTRQIEPRGAGSDDPAEPAQAKAGKRPTGLAFRNAVEPREIDLKRRFA
jgi:hypothetical protein